MDQEYLSETRKELAASTLEFIENKSNKLCLSAGITEAMESDRWKSSKTSNDRLKTTFKQANKTRNIDFDHAK